MSFVLYPNKKCLGLSFFAKHALPDVVYLDMLVFEEEGPNDIQARQRSSIFSHYSSGLLGMKVSKETDWQRHPSHLSTSLP